MERMVILGASLCFASSALAAGEGSNAIIVFLGMAAGIAVGIIGIVQAMRSKEVESLLRKQSELQAEISCLKDDVIAAKVLAESIEKLRTAH